MRMRVVIEPILTLSRTLARRLPRSAAMRGMVYLSAILLLAFGLRVYELGHRDVEGDEAFSHAFSIEPVENIYRTTLEIQEPHPVGSYLLLHYVLPLTGRSEFGLRFYSVWFGVLAVAAIYRLGRRLRLGDASTPIIAALLLAISPFLVEESRDARMYSMSVGLTVLSTWLAIELILFPQKAQYGVSVRASRFRSAALLAAYILVSWIALNVHYFVGAVLLAQNIYILAVILGKPIRSSISLIARWTVAQVGVLLLFIPWYLVIRDMLSTYPGLSYFAPTLGFMLNSVASIYIIGDYFPALDVFASVLAALAMGIGVIRLLRGRYTERHALLLLVLLIAVPLMLSYLDSRNRATFAERQVIVTASGFYLLLAAGITPLRQVLQTHLTRVATFATITLLCIVLTLNVLGLAGYYGEQFGRPSYWRPFAQLVQRYSANLPEELLRVAQNYPDPGMTFYYKQFPYAVTIPYRRGDAASADEAVAGFVADNIERVIMRMDPGSWWNGGTATDIAQTALSAAYTKVHETWTGRWIVVIYSRINAAQLTPVGIAFENGVTLRAAAMRSLTALQTSQREKVLEVHLNWSGDAKQLRSTHKVFIHVLDANGQVPAQLDVPLLERDLTAQVRTYGVPLPDNLPAGNYTVRVGLYDPALSGMPRLRTSDNNDGVQIGTLTIAP